MKINKICLIVFIFAFLVGTVNAWEWDNVKNYDEETRTITVTNALGLGDDIASIQLKTEPIHYVIQGRNRLVAEFEIESFEDYNNVFSKMEFYDINKGMKKFDREFVYKYKTYKDVEKTKFNKVCPENDECYREEIGTQIEQEVVWNEFNSKTILPKGTITIGVFTDVYKNDYVEWIPTLFGERINEWATWTDSLEVGLIAYYNGTSLLEQKNGGLFNLIIGNGNPTVNVAGGIIGTCYDYDGTDDKHQILETNQMLLNHSVRDMTINYWVIMDNAGSLANIGKDDDEWYSYSSAGGQFQLYNLTATNLLSGTKTTGVWYMITIRQDGTNVSFWQNGTVYDDGTALATGNGNSSIVFGEGFGTIMDGRLDEIAFWNRSLTDAEILELYNDKSGITRDGYDSTNPDINITSPINNTITDENTIDVLYTRSDDSSIDSCWYSNGTYKVNKTLASCGNITDVTWAIGIQNVTIWVNDTYGRENHSQIFFNITVDTTYPEVNITLPMNTTYITTNTTNNYIQIELNWTTEESNPDTCWWTNNSGVDNVTVPCQDNMNSTKMNLTWASHKIDFYINDTSGNINSSSVTANWRAYIIENSRTFNTTSLISTLEQFNLNITSDGSQTPIVYLVYNGTTPTLTTLTNGQYIVNKTMSLLGNNSFYWTINYGASKINLTTSNQYVSDITTMNVTFASCPAGMTKVMNFTFFDEINLTSIPNVEIKYNFQYGVTTNGSLHYGSINATELSICLNTSLSSSYYIGYGEIEYSKDTYSSRRYYIFDGTRVSNITTYTPLYLLPSASSTSFLIEIREPTLIPYINKYTTLLRWYPNLNEYRVVEMGKTDDKGQTVKKVQIEDADYRVGIYELDGTLIYLASPIRMVCLASPCSYTLTVTETTSYTFDELYNIQSSLDYSGGIFTLTYNDPSQNTELITLDVYKIGGTASDTLICSSNSTAFTGIITCDVSTQTGMLKAIAYRTASPTYPFILKVIDTSTTIFQGTFGLFIQFLISTTLIFLGIFSPVLSIILGLISLLFGVLLFKTVTYAIFIGVAILSGLIIHFIMEKEK